MNNRKIYCLILAAGDGKRMNSDKPKVLQQVLFTPMLEWVLDCLEDSGADKTAVVVGNGREQVEEFLSSKGEYLTYVQTERKGTGHAVMQAEEFIRLAAEDNAEVLVACGDAPFIDSETVRNSLAFHRENANDITVISAVVDNPRGYGRIIRENGVFARITEEKDCTEAERAVCEINSGLYWFAPEKLLSYLGNLGCENASGEYYLTDTVALADKKGAYAAANADVVLGANTRRQLSELNKIARDGIIGRHLDNGVDIPLADGIIIGKDVVIGRDTVIMPGTVIKGKTVIGSGCEIGPNSFICDCVIGDGVQLNNVHAHNSTIDDGAKAGPFVHLRPGTHLHSGVKIGDFVEVKNSEVGINTCIAHLTYIGDSDVGKGVNFGCGCVTANYDGINKYRTVIGDNAFIGCNTNMIAPVAIGDNATTAAGSTITRDVPANSLAIERGHQKVYENWEKNNKRIKKA